MKKLFEKYKHIWILSYAFIYIPWFLYLEKTVTTDFYVIHTWMDDLIPFNEYFIIPYLLWFAYVAGAIVYFFFTSKQDYYRLCIFLFTGMTISLFICTIFPNGTDLRIPVDPNTNICAKLVTMLQSADTSTNIFPSIHAFNSIVVHIAIMKSRALKNRHLLHTGSFVLMLAICMATVSLKQHSIVDIAGAGLMVYVIYPFVYSNEYTLLREKLTRKALS